MKRAFLFILLSTFTLASRAQTDDQVRVQSVIIKLFEGIANYDNKAIGSQLTADFMLLENGRIWNTDSLLFALQPLRKKHGKRVNKLEFLQTELRGRCATIIYRNTAVITVGDQSVSLHWLESAILTRDGQDWRIRLLHSTAVD